MIRVLKEAIKKASDKEALLNKISRAMQAVRYLRAALFYQSARILQLL